MEDTNVEILAVQMDDGTRHEFERPAAFETLDSGREVLAGPVATTYDGQPASTRLYLDVAEITSYELTEKNDKSLGVFASITAVAIFIAMVLSGISIGP